MELTDENYGGSGYGYGHGYGHGDGYGDGYGDGHGYGHGHGDGDGSGYGDGYGDGHGYGSGSGSGDDIKVYLDVFLEPYVRMFPNAEVVFWKSHFDGSPANGGSGTKAVIGATETISGPLKICTSQALHGTVNPKKWKGERWWIVALHHPVERDDDKIASLKRTFIADLGKCPFQS